MQKTNTRDTVTAEAGRSDAAEKREVPALALLLETVTERRLSGRRAGVLGGESRLKALAIMRVAAERGEQLSNFNNTLLITAKSPELTSES